MKYQDVIRFFDHVYKDPSRLIFEDELTQIYNRRFLFSYFESQVLWDELDDRPLSLIMVDLDNFKDTNDNYGHQAGDQVLTWVAELLREVAGEDGMAIRYAGDEFMVLLPHYENERAVRKGEELLHRVRGEQFMFESGDRIKVSFSIGVATAPSDATSSKHLIQQADMALYYAKKAGRDRLANAGEVGPEEVFSKKAIYSLDEVELVGRERQMSQTAEALRNFLRRENQFLLIEGGPGLGKSEFLETIRRNLARTKMMQVKVSGVPQEMFRPYYLATKILLGIFNQMEDRGIDILESMDPKKLTYLSHLLPHLADASEQADGENENEVAQREGIFTTLVQIIPQALNNRPLILLIDDLHFADEATLILLRRMLQRGDIPIFICGTRMESKNGDSKEQGSPLDRFYEAHREELNISNLVLPPLSAPDILRLIQGIFPAVRLPESFQQELVEISQGNPLFLSEILRKLVLDQKITLSGQQWEVQPLEENYLPRSLEEIVTEKIAALNEEELQLLAQASAFGEDVSLSVLIGSSDKMEAKVQAFLDQAVEQGLLSTHFALNDETIHFLGKRILEITYGGIDPQQKEELHEHIGNYQESLFHQQLLPSAATLAYHFRRSADQVKASNYEQLQAAANRRIFNAREAQSYTGDWSDEGGAVEIPLDPEDLHRIPSIIRHFMSAVHNNRLYPPGSKSIVTANQHVRDSIEQILQSNEHVSLCQSKGSLLVNGQRMDISGFKVIGETFLQLLGRFVLKGISFHRGFTEKELEVLTETLAGTPKRLYDEDHWGRFSKEMALEHVELQQVHYAIKGKLDESSKQLEAAKYSQSAEIRLEKFRHIPQILRGLLGAARASKLYPIRSKAFSNYVEKFMKSLRDFLARQPVLTLSQVGNALLVNGERIDCSDFKTLADGFLKFLDYIGLSSISFLSQTDARELQVFFAALGNLPSGGVQKSYWEQMAEEQKFAGILFDRHLYESWVAESGNGMRPGEGKGTLASETTVWEETHASPASEAVMSDERFEAFLRELPERVNSLFLRGKEGEIGDTVQRLFDTLQGRPIAIRQEVPAACRKALEHLTVAHRYDFIRYLAGPMIADFADEQDPQITVQTGNFLYALAGHLIELANYALAGQILVQLQNRYRSLRAEEDPRSQTLAKILSRKLDASTERVLVEDLKSGDPRKRRNASLLLAGLGEAGIPLLVDIIKGEDHYRARRIAIMLLGERGPEGAEKIKRELAQEISAEERVRMLEVIDSLTRDVRTELSQALGDSNPKVRQAALRLAERVNENQVGLLLLQYPRDPRTEVAVGAIKSMGKLKSAAVSEELVDVLRSSRQVEVQTACCRALGQIGDPSSIDALVKVLAPQRFLFFKRGRDPQVREAAAVALAGISRPRAAEVLAGFADDRDHVIREIAQGVIHDASLAPGTPL